jgi:acetyl esterase/lipase
MRNILKLGPVLRVLGLLCFLFAVMYSTAQENAPLSIPLWKDGAPGYENRKDEPEQAKDWWVRNIHNPSVTIFLPPKEKANGTAVLICPGGGHRNLVYNAEGRDAALFLNSLGVTAFVLKYRLFREEGSVYTLEKEVRQDAYRAMRLVRSRSAEWGIDPQRLGIMGFSAGGEVVSLVAYGPGTGDAHSKDQVEREGGRPDFQILVYPGPLGIPSSVDSFAPPAFLVAANNDTCCSEPIVKLMNAYRAANRPLEVHLYAAGDHAFNMGYRTPLLSLQHWPQRLSDWMQDAGLLQRK